MNHMLADTVGIDTQDDRGPWIATYTGRKFHLLDPHPDEVDIRDIAHSLSMLCRYTGHVRRFYSVAEHCVRLARHPMQPWEGESREFRADLLMHDATEAYLSDISRPLKSLLPEYQRIERRAWRTIAEKFGLAVDPPVEVKVWDKRILTDETMALLPPNSPPWPGMLPALGVRVPSVNAGGPETWEDRFLDCARSFLDCGVE